MRRYIVQLADAPLASYSGGVAGLAATRPAGGSPDLGSPASHAYLDYLGAQQAKAVGAMSAALGRRVTPTFTYYYAVNGLAVNLTPAEAAQVAKLSGVVAVRPDAAYKPVQP
ncbi:MAG TPA: protease inhibitor I9 family protein [Gammaproteobacteria bacterium]|nr:protease inhibitor I9 family protein [Gammaproteobacteria bacterium]